jgi:anaerobic selenocysteine-containing dehydrogenase
MKSLYGKDENFEALKEAVLKYTPEYLRKFQISERRSIKAARMYASSGASAIVYAMESLNT